MLTSAQATDVGRVRDHNEDYYVARPDLGLWLVADGMGGHAAGDVASAITGDVVSSQIATGVDLATAVEAAHQAILDAGQKGRGSVGMGCTLVALLCREFSYEISWVGDSRAYLWSDGQLRQLTRDHSFVQQMIDAGALTEAEARNHPLDFGSSLLLAFVVAVFAFCALNFPCFSLHASRLCYFAWDETGLLLNFGPDLQMKRKVFSNVTVNPAHLARMSGLTAFCCLAASHKSGRSSSIRAAG